MASGKKADYAPRENLSSIVGADAHLEGAFTLEGSLRVDGVVRGTLNCGGTVTIGPNGSLEGDVEADEVILGGKVAGTVIARRRVILEPSAVLEGDLATVSLVIGEGARFNGACGMGEGAVEEMRARLRRGGDGGEGRLGFRLSAEEKAEAEAAGDSATAQAG